MNSRDIILTGIPRSGTTLCCHLLNRLPGVVALHEPMNVEAFGGLSSRSEVLDHVESFFRSSRRSILERKLALSKHSKGRVPDNHFSDERDDSGERRWVDAFETGEIPIQKPLDPGFRLILKHPMAFAALLPEIGERFPVFAVVRNPLAVLHSWNDVPLPVTQGRVPAAERLDQELRRRLDDEPDVLERQTILLQWMFDRFEAVEAQGAILRYEDLIASLGAAVERIAPGSSPHPDFALKSRNRLMHGGVQLNDAYLRAVERLHGLVWRVYSDPMDGMVG